MCYHSEFFHGAMLDYPTYDTNLFVIIQEPYKQMHLIN
jgi:hypothetical protein